MTAKLLVPGLISLAFTAASPISANAAYIYANNPADGSCAFAFHGDIEVGDDNIFEVLLQDCTSGGVLFKSRGGNLLAGLRIGDMIRTAGLDTAVSYDAQCASACALAWLGGKERMMFPTSLVGFHAAYSSDSGTPAESGVGNALVGAYMNNLGLPLDAIIFASSASPSSMNWLNPYDAAEIGIDAKILTPSDMAWVKALEATNPY